MSFPLAKSTKVINIKNPTSCALSINFSLGTLLVIISYSKNITWPPSRAGIGNKFKTPNIIDKNAVRAQKSCQLQVPGNTS